MDQSRFATARVGKTLDERSGRPQSASYKDLVRKRKQNGFVSPPSHTAAQMNTTLSPMRSERPSLKGPPSFVSNGRKMNYGGKSLVQGRAGYGLGDSLELSPNQRVDQTSVAWSALGKYISKQMMSGKGVWVPKLGQFTFTGITVDLKGSTNPNDRDRQERFPVFLVAKDFVSGINLRTAIADGMTQEVFDQITDADPLHSYANRLRPFAMHGVSGIIPKVKTNYFEVSLHSQGMLSKDICRQEIETMVANLAALARSGKKVDYEIPDVGTLKIKDGLCGVFFDKQIIQHSQGHTAKNYDHRLQGNNWMNNKMYEPNRTNLGANATNGFALHKGSLSTRNADFGSLTRGPKGWRRSRANESVEMLSPQGHAPRLFSPQMRDSKQDLKNILNKSQEADFQAFDAKKASIADNFNKKVAEYQNKLDAFRSKYKLIEQRNDTAPSELSDKAPSKSMVSNVSTTISRLPELAPFQYMNMANEITLMRQKIFDGVNSAKFHGINFRDLVTSTKIQQVLAYVGLKFSVPHIKALLRELGFQWNGAAVTFQQLLQKTKEYIEPKKGAEPKNDPVYEHKNLFNLTDDDKKLITLKRTAANQSIQDIVRDLFYTTGKTLYQIFREYGNGEVLHEQQFVDIVNEYSNNTLDEVEVTGCFRELCKYFGKKDELNYKDFAAAFKIEVPVNGSHISETKIIQKVREWMFVKQYSTNCAFERLIRTANRLRERTLRRSDLQLAGVENGMHMNQPEIDFLFDLLASGSQNKEVTFELWSKRVFDDALNPLLLIREVVVAESMDADDVLFQMKLNYFDEPLDYPRFMVCVRRLDPTFSDTQCRALFDKLKNKVQLVEIQTLLTNLCGTVQDTVDYKARFFKDLYKEIFAFKLDTEFLTQMEAADANNDGRIEPNDLERIILRVTGGINSKYSPNDVRKFVRQLPRDTDQLINYADMLDKVQFLGNRNHNPFKDLIQRIKFFLNANNLTFAGLLKRFGEEENPTLVPVKTFADFLKAKINKKAEYSECLKYAHQIDVDKDGYVGVLDLQTVVSNLKSISFFDGNGTSLNKSQFNTKERFFPTTMKDNITATKASDVCARIRQGMMDVKYGYRKFFDICDTNSVGMINLAQFISGVNSFVPVSAPLLEKLFDIMDSNKIGMIDYEKFTKVLSAEAPSQIPLSVKKMEDSFIWQEQVIKDIKNWVKEQKLTSLEAFRSFDHDMDGLISRDDMKRQLIVLLRYRNEDFNPARMDRLFRVLSFFKTEQIQPSDFQRLLEDVNPFAESCSGNTDQTFAKSMGGGFGLSSTFDWKLAAIHQLGLVISLKYSSIEESFYSACRNSDKINYNLFREFIRKHDALKGFSLTEDLYQKLFAEMDPHKKTFLSVDDWKNAFQTFNTYDNVMIELKNFLQVQFANVESAFAFFQSFGNADNIDYNTFSKAARSLIASRKLSGDQIRFMFNRVSAGKSTINEEQFLKEHERLVWKGKQVITTRKHQHQNIGNKNIDSKKRGSQLTSKWEKEIIERLKKVIKSSGKSISAIFGQFDVDGSGDITSEEFRLAMKEIHLGLSDNDINRIMQRVDANNDGYVSYLEFAAKFRDDPEFDKRMVERANDRLAQFKELMIHYMTSATDSYRMMGKLTFLDWDKLIRELCRLSKTEVPCYSVIKDMFDSIDKKHDQILDRDEWNETFGGILTTGPKVAVKATPYTYWESGLEAQKLGECFARSRKLLIESFKEVSTHSDHMGESRFVTLTQAKEALEPVLKAYFKDKFHYVFTDQKLSTMMRVGQVVTKISSTPDIPIYDFMKVLNTYKDRYQMPQCQ